MLYIDSEEDMLQLLKCDGWESLSFTKRAFSGARSLGGEIFQALGISSFDFFAALQTRGVEEMRYPEEQLFHAFLYPDWRNGLMRKRSEDKKDLSDASR
jgi:hypothetical protein